MKRMSSVRPNFCDDVLIIFKARKIMHKINDRNTTWNEDPQYDLLWYSNSPLGGLYSASKKVNVKKRKHGESCCVGNDNFHWGRPYCADLRKHQHFICWYIAGWRAMSEIWRKEALFLRDSLREPGAWPHNELRPFILSGIISLKGSSARGIHSFIS